MSTVPTQAEIVIVGGGIAGVSVAYHLAKLGKRDVLLLERDRFAGCPSCRRVYWSGSHAERMRATLARVLEPVCRES